jgi:hypothetical protein
MQRWFCHHDQQRVCGVALIAVTMAEDVKIAFRETESHLVQQAGLYARCGNRGWDGGCAHSRFHRRAYGLVGRQFQLDAQCAQLDTKMHQGFLEGRPCSRSGLTQHPLAFDEIGRRQAIAPDPPMLRPNDHDQLIPRNPRAGEMLILNGSFDEA